MAHCWLLLTSGGQHKVMDDYEKVAARVGEALETQPNEPLTLDGLPGVIFPKHVVSVRPGE